MKPPKPDTPTRPLPPRPAAGGVYRLDEVTWAYVPVEEPARPEAPGPAVQQPVQPSLKEA